MSSGIRALIVAASTALLVVPASAAAATPARYKSIERGLQGILDARGGPPGGIATIHRGGRTTVIAVGRANVARPGAPRVNQHMRIASVSKAFSAAVALNLVQKGRLGLDDTVGQRLAAFPTAWHAVTVRQMLNHTSGLPDYTKSQGVVDQFTNDPHGFVSPATMIGWVKDEPLRFTPGSKYEYSNTDNVVVALIAEDIAGEGYGDLMERLIFNPTRLTETSFDMHRISLPRPFIRGYLVEPGERPEDVTTLLSMSGAWSSGGITSTPRDMGRFIRADLRGDYFGPAQKRQQRRFVKGGTSDPPGPGTNSAGLGLFRYKTRCGTVYGHTGHFPGYMQWAAATPDGRRSATTSFNIPRPEGALMDRVRRVQAAIVCALLRK
jgi:D-alanyl-D-alanine carboxypeptidase